MALGGAAKPRSEPTYAQTQFGHKLAAVFTQLGADLLRAGVKKPVVDALVAELQAKALAEVDKVFNPPDAKPGAKP